MEIICGENCGINSSGVIMLTKYLWYNSVYSINWVYNHWQRFLDWNVQIKQILIDRLEICVYFLDLLNYIVALPISLGQLGNLLFLQIT